MSEIDAIPFPCDDATISIHMMSCHACGCILWDMTWIDDCIA